MEKASKWIINHLMGKKEEKYKVERSCIENNIAESPRTKRRWSFGRKSGVRITGNTCTRRFSASFDSSHSANLQIQSLMRTEPPYSFSTTLLPKAPRDLQSQSAAAIKIQAAFRSYLVTSSSSSSSVTFQFYAPSTPLNSETSTLQGEESFASLEGTSEDTGTSEKPSYLVRKQTSATLRGMHALMATQVRARIHRLEAAQEANLLLTKHSSRHPRIPRDNHLRRESKDSKDMDPEGMLEIMESRSGPLDPSNTEHVAMSFYSKQKYQCKDNSFTAEQSSSGNNLSSSQRHSMSWEPNDVTRQNLRGLKPKARPRSEPKQRPVQGTRRKSKSVESTKDLILSSNSSCFIYHGNLDHWVMNHYESHGQQK